MTLARVQDLNYLPAAPQADRAFPQQLLQHQARGLAGDQHMVQKPLLWLNRRQENRAARYGDQESQRQADPQASNFSIPNFLLSYLEHAILILILSHNREDQARHAPSHRTAVIKARSLLVDTKQSLVNTQSSGICCSRLQGGQK